MRYKPYILTGLRAEWQIGCGSILYIRHGSDFAEAGTPIQPGYRRATEVKDGVWFIGSVYGSKYGDTYMVPEDNEFFNFYALKKGIFEIDVFARVSDLIIKYLQSLKS